MNDTSDVTVGEVMQERSIGEMTQACRVGAAISSGPRVGDAISSGPRVGDAISSGPRVGDAINTVPVGSATGSEQDVEG